jgi:hypothetical protein
MLVSLAGGVDIVLFHFRIRICARYPETDLGRWKRIARTYLDVTASTWEPQYWAGAIAASTFIRTIPVAPVGYI